jgi:hypothetical protein
VVTEDRTAMDEWKFRRIEAEVAEENFPTYRKGLPLPGVPSPKDRFDYYQELDRRRSVASQGRG